MQDNLTTLTEKELLDLYNLVIEHIDYLNSNIISSEESEKDEQN